MSGDDLFWAKYNLSGALEREAALKVRVAELEKERDDLHRQVKALKAYLPLAKEEPQAASTIGNPPTKEKEA